MSRDLLTVLGRGDLIVGDGAMGTMLQSLGLPAGALPEAWNADNPDAVRQVHRAYLDAGAMFLTTNTFGGNRPRLTEGGLADRADDLNRLGAELARSVAGDAAWVAGSIGPTGQLMEPYGPLTVQEAEAIFAGQAGALARGGADFIKIETQHDIEEACAAIRAAKAATGLPVFCSFAFNVRGRTMMGLRPEDAVQRAIEAGADVVGANCGDGPAAVVAALEAMRQVTDLPLMAQSNAGIPQMGHGAGDTLWDVTPEQMAEHAREFVALGARVLAGCCGTGPAFIAAMRAALVG
ncbi:MAG TPA: hypothetical protein GX702_05510 [Chloroflexi bacterium]|nr:hypothetical protein [Chloroflexota bacterium]